jgi:hypothetical protein
MTRKIEEKQTFFWLLSSVSGAFRGFWRASNISLGNDSFQGSGGQGLESSNLGFCEVRRNPKR